jgi:hypothetical protein
MRPHSGRSTPAILVLAVCCLLLSTTGGAVAGGLITGAKIKNGTVTTKDIKNGTVKSEDIRDGAVSSTDVRDGTLTGIDVADGSLTEQDIAPATATSLRGVSPLDPLPSGRTVSGVWTASGDYPENGAAISTAVALPLRAPTPINAAAVLVDGTGTEAGRCTGTVAEPTAPPGFACIYWPAPNATVFSVSGYPGYQMPANPYGFVISVQGTGTYANVDVVGTWAYTAP